jgi:hypothetical protein
VNNQRFDELFDNISKTQDFEVLFAELGLDPADDVVNWGDTPKPDDVLEARVIAEGGESLFGDSFRVILLSV